jgi:hypothetical protein
MGETRGEGQVPKGGFMTLRVTPVFALTGILVFAATANADCARPVLVHEAQDTATIQRLETAWSLAYLTGDTEFEACLLTPDFTEIMSNGRIDHLGEELALAEKNKGKEVTNPALPATTVHIHGNVAVAYGISSKKMIDGKPYQSWFADYYIWTNGGWHVYFAQQTSFSS